MLDRIVTMPDENAASLLALTTQIVSAHVSHNEVQAAALPALIQQVYQALSHAGAPPAQPERPEPAVPIKRSVFPDHIICLEDGKSFKTLRRHLQNVYGLSPDQYRERWGLPTSYPMVAPAYAEHRSRLAKSFGLGRKAVTGTAEASGAAEDAPAPRKRGRPAKAAAE